MAQNFQVEDKFYTRTEIAVALGISTKTLSRKLNQLNINLPKNKLLNPEEVIEILKMLKPGLASV